jgi:S-sulfo-L-cysteine synthase (O-acetyl-L-serine-dependent)
MYSPDPAPVADGTRTRSVGASRADSILAEAGHTSLLNLSRIVAAAGGRFELWAKAEFENPSGSVKDRAAASIVREALRHGELDGGRILLDASSGNTAVAYARLGARLGFPVTLFVPRNANPERLDRLRAWDAQLVLTDPIDGTDGAQRRARKLAEEQPDRYYYADQYNNPANPRAHYEGTGPEIWEQTRGRVTVFVAGVGTGGTISGTARFLKEKNPNVHVVGVQPTGPMHGLEGLKHLPSALRPSTYDGRFVDETRSVETEVAQACQVELTRVEGLRVGPSSGAAVAASLELGRERPGACIVTLLPDAGEGAAPGGP